MEAKLNFQTKTFAGWSQVIIHQHTATNGLIKIISWFLCLDNIRTVGVVVCQAVRVIIYEGTPVLGNKRRWLWWTPSEFPVFVSGSESDVWDPETGTILTRRLLLIQATQPMCVCGQQVNDMQTLLDTGINQIFCVASVSWTKNRLIALTPPEKCLIILLFKIIDHHEEQLSWWASQCFDETTHAQGLTESLTAPPSQCRLERVVVPETGCKLPDCLSMTRG